MDAKFSPEDPPKSRDSRRRSKEGIKDFGSKESRGGGKIPPPSPNLRFPKFFSFLRIWREKDLPKKLGKEQVTKSSVTGKSLRWSRALPKESASFQLLSPRISWSSVLWKCHRSCPGWIFWERSPWCSIKKWLLPFIPKKKKKSGNLELSRLEK